MEKNVFGTHLKMNAFLNLKANLHYTKYIYNETIFQFIAKRVIGRIISSGVLSFSQPKGKPYCQSCRPKKYWSKSQTLQVQHINKNDVILLALAPVDIKIFSNFENNPLLLNCLNKDLKD